MAEKNACNDWAKDNASGSDVMAFDSFLDSMFELASTSIKRALNIEIALDMIGRTFGFDWNETCEMQCPMENCISFCSSRHRVGSSYGARGGYRRATRRYARRAKGRNFSST